MTLLRLSSLAFACALGAALSGCRSAEYEASYDSSVDFTAYESFQWKEDSLRRAILPDASRVDVKGIIENELESRGYQRLESGADLTVLVVTAAEVHSFGAGPESLPVGYVDMDSEVNEFSGADALSEESYTRTHLIIDLLDTDSGQLVWRGYVTGLTDNVDRTARLLPGVISTLFRKEFPIEAQDD